MRLSVVTPSYGSAPFIEATLDSVAALRTPHEHLVMDGGSQDGTAELLRGRNDPQLVWVSEPDRGQTHAVNKGLERATGDLCAWLNADDAFNPAAVDRAIAFLAEHPDVDVLYAGIQFTDEHLAVRRTYIPAAPSFHRYLFLGDYIPTPTFIFRRSLLAATRLLDERWVDAADYDFYLRLMHRRRVHRFPEPLVRFRFHPGSKTARDAMKAQDEAMQIRLRWARKARHRAVMRGFDALKRAVLPRISGWPEPYGTLRSDWGSAPEHPGQQARVGRRQSATRPDGSVPGR
jgi:glycosyltransferase involved in cell wall biosynthesis